MNIRNLTKLKNFLETLEPARFDMRQWSDGDLIHDCGTTGCIGGWTEALWPDRGAMLTLDLTDQEAVALFFPPSGPTRVATPKQAAAVIDHLIETGEVKWYSE
jgi:hypothetical protein